MTSGLEVLDILVSSGKPYQLMLKDALEDHTHDDIPSPSLLKKVEEAFEEASLLPHNFVNCPRCALAYQLKKAALHHEVENAQS